MSIVTSLEAVERMKAGKGPSRELRRSGMVPAIVYGEKKDPEMCALNPKALHVELQKPGF
jgi:large subunit ribosomal protein L25